MRPGLIGLAVVASLTSSLIGTSGLGNVASAQGCGGAAYQEPCDYDSWDDSEQYEEPPRPTLDPWVEAEMDLSKERNAWADAHLATEKAVATWWRAAVLSFEDTEWSEYRQGALVEQVPNGIPGDAVYPVNGRVRVNSYSGAELERVAKPILFVSLPEEHKVRLLW